MPGANSTEMDPETPYPVIDLLPEQREIARHGRDDAARCRPGEDAPEGTTRLRGIREGVVYERHRHRYEVNNHLKKQLEAAGLVFSGTTPDERLVEITELPRDVHPFYVASQFHPEFKSRPDRPSPLFREFVGAAYRVPGADSLVEPLTRRTAKSQRHALGSAPRRPPHERGLRVRARSGCTRRSRRSAGSRARPATSAVSPTGSRVSWRRSASRSRRTARARRSAPNAGNLLATIPGP